MTEMTEKERCARGCMWLGAGVGLAIALMLWLIGSWGFVLSVILGIILGTIAFFVFTRLFCSAVADSDQAELPARTVSSSAPAPAPTPAPAAPVAEKAADVQLEAPEAPEAQASAPVGGGATEATAGTSAASAASATPTKAAFSGIRPSKELKGQQELSARKGSYKYVAPHAAKAAPAPAAQTAPVVDSAAHGGGALAESKPMTLTQARDGGADDLKRISGVGPKLEQTLNELGFYHFDQIASWSPQEVTWVDSRLRFKGRIQRENWMEQARALGEGAKPQTSANTKNT